MCSLSYPEQMIDVGTSNKMKFDSLSSLLCPESRFAGFLAVSITDSCSPCDSKRLRICGIITAMQCNVSDLPVPAARV